MVAVAAFLATRVVAVLGAALALSPTVPLRHLPYLLGTAWDGEWYQHIAVEGYDSSANLDDRLRAACDEGAPANCRVGDPDRHSNLAFFPLFPAMLRALGPLGLDPWQAALLIAGAASMAAAALIALIARDIAGPRFAIAAVALWGCWPANIVLSSGRPEGVFVALTAGALLLTLRRRLLAAAGLAALAGLVRFQAIAVVVPVVITAWTSAARRGRLLAPIATTVLAPAGLVASLALVAARMSTPTGWFDIQREWDSTSDFGAAKLQYVGENLFGPFATHSTASWTLLASTILLIAMLLIRMPWQLVIYSAILLAGVVVQANYHQHSMRFLLVAFPLVFPIAWVMRRWPTWALAVSLAAIAVASALLQIPLWREGFSF